MADLNKFSSIATIIAGVITVGAVGYYLAGGSLGGGSKKVLGGTRSGRRYFGNTGVSSAVGAGTNILPASISNPGLPTTISPTQNRQFANYSNSPNSWHIQNRTRVRSSVAAGV